MIFNVFVKASQFETALYPVYYSLLILNADGGT
jgi:hypothetical protein